jgi:hypothetical protein
MPLLVNSVPNLAQGVSQQPDNLRFPGQCDEQINAWATVVEGLVKRPPTEYTKKINSSSTNADKLFTHFVKRSEQNKYCVAVSLGGIGVINVADGTQVSIAVTSIANSYLSLGGQASLGGVANPLADLRALTVADYTFLVNKNKVIENSTDVFQKSIPPGGNPNYVSYNNYVYKCLQTHTSTSSFETDKWEIVRGVDSAESWETNTVYKAQEHEALIVVKLGDYEKNYSVFIDDARVPHVSSSSLNYNHAPQGDYTYESGSSTGGAGIASAGLHADTSFIAHDLAYLIEQATTSTGSVSLDIVSGGSNWLDGESSGDIGGIKLKLILTVSQIDAVTGETHKALFNMSVTKGVITGYSEAEPRGIGFDPSVPFTQTFNASWAWQGLQWTEWRPVEGLPDAAGWYGSGQNITINNFTRSPFNVEHKGSIIKIKSTDGSFNIRAEDGLGDQALGVVYREVNSITDLPVKCFNGFRVKVIGDSDINQDDYYVRFSTKDKTDFGEGSWVEVVGYYQDESPGSLMEGIDTSLKNDTMPVTLVPFFNGNEIKDFRLQTPNELLIVKQGSAYYRLDKEHSATNDNKPGVGTNWEDFWTEYVDITQGYLEWKLGVYYYGRTDRNNKSGWSGRSAGDDFTNPFPSFVGKRIRDLFFFKNRLGILTDSNVIFSEADEYFNFFRTTTQQLLDSAVIDVGLSHTKVAILEHAVPFQEKLMLFSQGSQFVLRGADVLSPRTVAISPVTEYDLSDGIQPVALGNYIYFPFKRNDFEGVYEYFVDNNTETFNSEEITQQIPKYITSDIQKMVGSQAENTIVISTTADPKTLFVYKYFWSNKEKVQSAWMKFTFERDVRGFDFIDSNLHLITADTDGLHLEKLTLEDGITDDGLDYTLYLDSKVDGSALTTSYDAAAKTTTISGFPYDPTNVAIYTKNGHNTPFTRTSSSAGTVSGDLTSTPFFAGKPYNMLYRFSDQTLKQPTERGGRSASDYAYQTIRNGSINYADTGHFTVEVTAKFRDTYSYAFNPDIVGANLTLNQFTPQNGHFRFPVQAQPNEATIEVKSDSALPVKLLGAEFESMFIPRSRRYGA